MGFQFQLLKTAPNGARRGRLHTPHGVVETPAFMPVGTAGTVRALTQDALEELGVEMLLANTYHLYLRPGPQRIRELGGLHAFMGWKRAILTDSGGFQIFSLAELRKVTEQGVVFRSHLDGSEHFLTPEKSLEIQMALGADIMMVLDECIAVPASKDQARAAAERTLRWAQRSQRVLEQARQAEQIQPADQAVRARAARSEMPASSAVLAGPASVAGSVFCASEQALFGIVQGGTHVELRHASAQQLVDLNLDGYAIGGLAVGEQHEVTCQMTAEVTSLLPAEKPRYLMGVGLPEHIPDYIARGVDMMDCVLPTRNARNGCLFTSEGRLAIRNAQYASDARPADEQCGCAVCRRYSRAYLRHLFLAKEMLGPILASHHNVQFYLDLLRRIREAIDSGT
jgi:queuine tRNA-ribosyltransferase